MPKRKPIDKNLVIKIFDECRNGAETARRLGIHSNTVYQTLKVIKGLCKACPKKVKSGSLHCPKCLKRINERSKRKRAVRRKLGICSQCNSPVQFPSRTYCSKHREAHIHSNKEYKKKNKRGQPNGGIPSKKQKERRLREKYGSNGVEIWRRYKGSCTICGVSHKTTAIHIHHIDCAGSNNALHNLTLLCFYCHQTTHRILALKAPKNLINWIKETYHCLD